MQVIETLSDGLKRAFTVVLPSADVENRRVERLAEISKTLRLPGFRPGKVPPSVVRQRYGTAIAAEVVEESIQAAVQQVLTERGLRPAIQPSVDLVNQDAVAASGVTADLEFKMALEVLPDIALPDFSSISLTRLKAEVSDEVLGKALDNLALRNRTFEEIKEDELAGRGAEKGEFVVMDYTGRIDGEEFPGGKATDARVEVGGEGFIPGFTEQVVGIRPGETRTITVTFPEGYPAAHLAGNEALFNMAAKRIERASTPAIDEAFAQRLSFETIDELKDFVRSQIGREYDQLSRTRLKRDLLDRLNAAVSFALPPTLVETEFNQIWARVEADRNAGTLDEEDKAKDEDALKADYRAIAERRVKLGLLLAEVGRQNNIGISNEELSRAMRAEAMGYPGQESQILEFFRKNPRAVDTLRGPIFEEKAVDLIVSRTAVADRVVSPEELARDPEEKAAPESGVEPADAGAEASAEAPPVTAGSGPDAELGVAQG